MTSGSAVCSGWEPHGSRLLFADFSFGAFGQAAGGTVGTGCGNGDHVPYQDRRSGLPVKSIKSKVSDIDKMKVEEQKKAARAGYDMDILPPDLVTYSNDAKTLLEDLQSRNERMFLLTFLIVNMAPTRRERKTTCLRCPVSSRNTTAP